MADELSWLSQTHVFYYRTGMRRAIAVLIKYNEPFHCIPGDKTLIFSERGRLLLEEAEIIGE